MSNRNNDDRKTIVFDDVCAQIKKDQKVILSNIMLILAKNDANIEFVIRLKNEVLDLDQKMQHAPRHSMEAINRLASQVLIVKQALKEVILPYYKYENSKKGNDATEYLLNNYKTLSLNEIYRTIMC